MEISIIQIRQSWDRLIFVMDIPILVRRHLSIETVPGSVDLTVKYTFGFLDHVLLGFIEIGYGS